MDVDTPAVEDPTGRRSAALLSRRAAGLSRCRAAMLRLRPLIQAQNGGYDVFEFERHGDLSTVREVGVAGCVRYRADGNAKCGAHLRDRTFYLDRTRSRVFVCHTQALGLDESFDGREIFRLSGESLLGGCARCGCEIA